MNILGVRVDEIDMEQALAKISGCIATAGDCLSQVITINPEGVMLARGDAELRRIIEEADLVTPDGNGILWAAKRLGQPLRERVTGIELCERLAGLAAEKGWRVYFLGARPGLAQLAALNLLDRHPGLIVAGWDNGYFRDREEQAIAAVREAQADLLFAALGMPYQEKWLHAHKGDLGVKAAIGVGGSFDVLSGTVKRAPLWLQRLRLEWLWRLLSDPKRWRRFLAIPRFMLAVRREAQWRQDTQSE